MTLTAVRTTSIGCAVNGSSSMTRLTSVVERALRPLERLEVGELLGVGSSPFHSR